MLEREFQSKFNRYALNLLKTTAVFELKVSGTTSLPFRAVVDHQVHALWVAKHGTLVHKIPDLGNQNPFDCFIMAGVPAYVVIMFECNRRSHKEFVMIDIDDFVNERDSSTRKSLTFERACEIGKICHLN